MVDVGSGAPILCIQTALAADELRPRADARARRALDAFLTMPIGPDRADAADDLMPGAAFLRGHPIDEASSI